MPDPTPDVVDVESVDRTPAVRQSAVVSPTTPTGEWNVIVAQAEVLARSQIIPPAYRNQPENIVAAAITGRQFGWDVMAAMRNTHPIEGVITIRPEAQVGLVRAAGHSISGSSSSERAVATGTRGDTGDTMTVEWTIDDAVRAGLCSIRDGQPYARSHKGKPLPWETFTSDMLWARAVSQLCRRLFSDVTLGLSYTPDEIARTDAPDFSGDVAGVGEEAAVTPPPDGWESWGECEAAHDALKAAVAAADPQARNRWKGYLRDSGYEAWFTRAQLDELAAQLEIIVGAPTERVDTTIPEAEVIEDETVGEGSVPDDSAGRGAGATPAPSPTPAAENGDQDGAALSLLDGTAAPAPGESGPEAAGGAPDPAPSDVPAPVGEPINKGLLNRIGARSSELGLDRGRRLAVCSFVCGRPVASMNEMNRAEGEWLDSALRLLMSGDLAIEDLEDGEVVLVIVDPTDGMCEDPEKLKGTAWMRGLAAFRGEEMELHTIDGED